MEHCSKLPIHMVAAASEHTSKTNSASVATVMNSCLATGDATAATLQRVVMGGVEDVGMGDEDEEDAMRLKSGISGLAVATALVVAGGSSLAQGGQPATAGPLAQFTTHLVTTHYMRGQPYETHHYFKPLREGVLQGLVFRQSTDGAPLIEVEWAISEQVYTALPDWQKEYWHPLAPAVDAKRVTLPDLTDAQESEMLQTVRGLHAQTINLAGIEGGLPVGLEGVAMATHLTPAEMLRILHSGPR